MKFFTNWQRKCYS